MLRANAGDELVPVKGSSMTGCRKGAFLGWEGGGPAGGGAEAGRGTAVYAGNFKFTLTS